MLILEQIAIGRGNFYILATLLIASDDSRNRNALFNFFYFFALADIDYSDFDVD